jgi:hypothetical protein
MKSLNVPFLAATLAAASLSAALPAHATEVGVSIQISQPGVYGRIDIGQFPQPVLVMTQPVIIQRPVYVVQQPQPVYLWVPPGHRKNWSKHCGAYNACGVPVYFVQDQWYDSHVRYPQGKSGGHDDDKGGGKNGNQGNGKSHGNGKGNGKD